MERAEAEAIYDQGRETVVAVLLRMDEQIQQLGKQVAKQDRRIAELERRLNRNSRNSSVPSSQDPPGTPEPRRPDPSERSQGAQPGHRGKGRGLLPLQALDRVVEHWPGSCGCGHRFAAGDLARAGQALEEPYEDLLERIRQAPALNIDETGWRLRGKKRTLWGAVIPRAAVFRIAPDRHEREALALVGEGFEGSSAPIAGGPTRSSIPPAARSAGRT